MNPLFLVLLPTLSEGPLARVELSLDRGESGILGGALVETLVDGLGSRLRADLRVLDGGLRIDAGCTRARCVLALDGLSPGVNAALPALADVLTGAPVKLAMPTRRALRRQWRSAWRVPSRLLDTALREVGERNTTHDGMAGGAGPKPRFRPADLREAWAALTAPGAWSELAVAGSFDEAAVRAVAERLGTPTESSAIAAVEPLPSPPAAPARLLIVDWPGAPRAQIAFAWAHIEADAIRERLLAGDFQSVLVQRLRETDALTYDVTPEYGEHWSGASFDVASESVFAAVLAARDVIDHVSQSDTAAFAGATLRYQAALASLDDTLAGRLALRQLAAPALAEAPTLTPVHLLGVAIVGDADTLTGPLRASFPDFMVTVTDRCALMYGGDCP